VGGVFAHLRALSGQRAVAWTEMREHPPGCVHDTRAPADCAVAWELVDSCPLLPDLHYTPAKARNEGMFLFRGQDGALVASYRPAIPICDVSSITSGNGFLPLERPTPRNCDDPTPAGGHGQAGHRACVALGPLLPPV
jgi:hypothetical protein